VYATPPKYVFTDYPPLFYHVVGKLAKLSGDYNSTGRWVSLFAYFAIGVLAGIIARELGGSVRAGAYSALCWWIWLAAFDPTRVGYNDPHLLGIVFGMTGLYCFLREQESTRWLVASALFFSLSLFTKNSLIAFPAAVAIELFLTSRKRLAIWLGATVAICVVFLGLTLVVDGPYFFGHLLFPRTFSFGDFLTMFTIYALMFQARSSTPLMSASCSRPEIWSKQHSFRCSKAANSAQSSSTGAQATRSALPGPGTRGSRRPLSTSSLPPIGPRSRPLTPWSSRPRNNRSHKHEKYLRLVFSNLPDFHALNSFTCVVSSQSGRELR
jgi:hypothetical protein